jgi:hemerythrin-like domain-containing protein
MQCLDLLNQEHRLVLRLLNVIKTMAREASAKQLVDKDDAERVLNVLDAFVDSVHELKEETALFPTVIQRATGLTLDDLRARVFEHNQERSLIEGMHESLKASDPKEFAWCAGRLADLMTEHVRRENSLFHQFGLILKEEDDQRIGAEFQKIDAEHQLRLPQAEAIVVELERKYRAAA